MSNWRPDFPLFSPAVHHRMAGSLILLLATALVATTLAPSAGAQAQDAVFSDSADAGVHQPNVDALGGLGYFAGTECDTDTFCPRDPVKRWVMAVWMVRVLGHKPLDTDASQFADASADEWWSPYAERIAQLEVTTGCKTEPLRYCPNKSVTRGQMATFLVRALKIEPAPSAGFVDTEGTTHEASIDALAAAGITSGCKTEPLSYCPNKPVTRAQMATFLNRAIPRSDRAILAVLYHSTGGPKWADRTKWLSNTPPSEWFGVTTDFEGRVIGLEIRDNRLAGRIPAVIGDLTELDFLTLRDNALTGPIPPELAKLPYLRHLDLTANELTGTIPPQLGQLSRLTSLELGKNELEGPIPTSLGGAAALQYLVLERNELSGPIPPELANLQNLITLFLGTNKLTGPIPVELTRMGSLLYLYLGHNKLEGRIPTELRNLGQLETLFLHNNKLEGRIPSALGELTNLKTLWLQNNDLTGEIPEQLSNLVNLAGFQLDDNRLEGDIPAWLADLPSLDVIHLGGNEFTGCIPEGLRDKYNDFHRMELPFC